MQTLGSLGGVFAFLVFWHFGADWLFQSHAEAIAKAKDRPARAWHCLKYTLAFMPVALFMDPWAAALTAAILFISHFIIDSYVPVMLWAKYLRKAPQFEGVGTTRIMRPWDDKVVEKVTYKTDEDAFKAFAATPLGLILLITMDQFFHIAFLLPVAWLVGR